MTAKETNRLLTDALEQYREFAQWATGSADFGVGGKARRGYLKFRRKLDAVDGALTEAQFRSRYGREEH